MIPMVEVKKFEMRSPTLQRYRGEVKKSKTMSPSTEAKLSAKMERLFGKSPITPKVDLEVVEADLDELYYSPNRKEEVVVTPKSKTSVISESLVDWVDEMEKLLWGGPESVDVGIKPIQVLDSSVEVKEMSDINLSDEEGVSKMISLIEDTLNEVPGKFLIVELSWVDSLLKFWWWLC